ncbi:hypothetical protein [Bradyrhizobium erythrophlei]|uniref:Uncharacterized protein n=1 Tax=Bradyrhizobium erythrophlei TaxID=1437360 RepID=A0A1M5NHG4_9BRAD|nr:hypothetical protein [Bradyrhizobium erythrophlei]SHG88932.1 hypothetical protein SAMN05443248_2998 [Bradyrhizobium erythrophlei]
MQSARYNAHFADLDLIEFTNDEIVARYHAGLSLSWQQRKDAERIIAARAPTMQQAAE